MRAREQILERGIELVEAGEDLGRLGSEYEQSLGVSRGGVHYTGEADVLRVLGGLLSRVAGNLEAIRGVRLFDPACGCGAFLRIGLRELLRLERELASSVEVGCHQVYGIELDAEAAEVARVSCELEVLRFGGRVVESRIVCGNALLMDWFSVCPPGAEVYVCGNPPFAGRKSEVQRGELEGVLGGSGLLDYCAGWIWLGAKYVASSGGECGLLVTSSVCQGEQVGLLWPRVSDLGVGIVKCSQAFAWAGEAGVWCVIMVLGLGAGKYNGYLRPGELGLAVGKRGDREGRARMVWGDKPVDDGNLILGAEEASALRKQHPELGVRHYISAEDMLNEGERYCFWLDSGEDLPPLVQVRVDRVRDFRFRSRRKGVRESKPYRFLEVRESEGCRLVLPCHTSFDREYLLVGYYFGTEVVGNSCSVIYGGELWLFALLSSSAHKVWAHAVCGRLGSSLRYSSQLAYNNLPFPTLDLRGRGELAGLASEVLRVRGESGRTLASLYRDMPTELRDLHERIDAVVDHAYGFGDRDRLEVLFELWSLELRGSSELSLEDLCGLA